MKIPFPSLSDKALAGLIQEFVSREGTEYGEVEASLEEKSQQILQQIQSGEAEIVFDPETQTTSIVTTGRG